MLIVKWQAGLCLVFGHTCPLIDKIHSCYWNNIFQAVGYTYVCRDVKDIFRCFIQNIERIGGQNGEEFSGQDYEKRYLDQIYVLGIKPLSYTTFVAITF